MNGSARLVVVIGFAMAMAAFVGVISIALDAPRVFPGMAVSFGIAVFQATLHTRRGTR